VIFDTGIDSPLQFFPAWCRRRTFPESACFRGRLFERTSFVHHELASNLFFSPYRVVPTFVDEFGSPRSPSQTFFLPPLPICYDG